MQPALVSIMMPAYNAAEFIGEAIESVLAQRYANWELVIVDDGSTDSTAGVVSRFRDPRIRLARQKNGGEAAARNTALDQMRGEFVAFLDADDRFLPDHLERAVAYLHAHPQIGAVYSDGYHIDPGGNRLQTLSSRRRGPFEGDIFEEVARASDVFGPPICTVLRRDTIVQHGLRFDTEIVIGPDWDFLMRYSALARFGYIPHCTCLYRIHQTNVTFRVDSGRRALYLARCREKAIRHVRFSECSAETRVAIFYDLLVNLLPGHPKRQQALTELGEFSGLPVDEQARLLRLMAVEGVVRNGPGHYIRGWLQRARVLDHRDRRGVFLHILYAGSPSLCRLVLQAKKLGRARQRNPASLIPLKQPSP